METRVQLPVFDGEASETDSEENVHISFYEDSITMDIADKVQCLEVNGEDAESGDEKDSISSNSQATILTSVRQPTDFKPNNRSSQSLLHQKLRESNCMLFSDLEEVIREFVKDHEKCLTEIDQHISKSQAILQGASPVLKNLQLQSVSLQNKLDTILSSNFLSNVKIIE